MADSVALTPARGLALSRVTMVRLATLVVLLVIWEAIARSGLLYKDVVPTLPAILGGIWEILTDPTFPAQFGVTLFEITVSLLIGGTVGIVSGIALGTLPFLARVFEPLIHYLSPTPKIIFFPLFIMWFGIGEGSKIGLGVVSAFFPVVISVASGMRQISEVYIRVGRSFRASKWQLATKIYIPAMRVSVVNGLRLAFGVTSIGILLSETKFARDGLGFMVTRYAQQFDMPAMYGIVIVIFAFAIGINALLGTLARVPGEPTRPE